MDHVEQYINSLLETMNYRDSKFKPNHHCIPDDSYNSYDSDDSRCEYYNDIIDDMDNMKI